jgi:hypothetical protein
MHKLERRTNKTNDIKNACGVAWSTAPGLLSSRRFTSSQEWDPRD